MELDDKREKRGKGVGIRCGIRSDYNSTKGTGEPIKQFNK